jgi:chemotaxis protein CheX
MAEMSVDFINPFLMAATSILKDMCQITTKLGKPYVKTTEFSSESVIIIIGVIGQLKGQVVVGLPMAVACDIASRMIMAPVTEMNELSMSALSELGNMILGNAATILSTKGIVVDITPPTLCQGSMSITSMYAQNICVPLLYDGGSKIIEMDVALKKA